MAHENIPQSKFLEQATSKSELSYSYWAANVTSSAPKESKKLTEEEINRYTHKMERAASSGASAWNSAGTFEERDLSTWAHGRVKEILKDCNEGASTVQIFDIPACTGDASQWIIRGQSRAGFDLDIEIKWKLTDKDITGTAKFNASCDDLDELELKEVTIDESREGMTENEKTNIKDVVQRLVPALKTNLEQLKDEIRKYGVKTT